MNGDPVEFEVVQGFLRVLTCAQEFNQAVVPEDHCRLGQDREGWGCKFLTAVGRHHQDFRYHSYLGGTFWFRFGSFNSDGVWLVDKPRIREALRKEADQKRLHLCSVLDFSRIQARVDALPSRIDVKSAADWIVVYEEQDAGLAVERKPVGVTPKARDAGSGFGVTLGFGQERPKTDGKKRNVPDVKFSDIGGIGSIIETIREVVELPLKRPEIFQHLGIRPHRGILLHGTPGCGKTLIAKAIANEVQAHFTAVRGPELLSKWQGQSEENLRDVFEEARAMQPSIIYFDEIDSLAQLRSGEENLRLESRFVNQMLTLMDGLDDLGSVCVIGSTNRPELIDEALKRPGRFDYTIEIPLPDEKGRLEILRIHTRKVPLAQGVDLEGISERLAGLSGADIAFVAREGAYNCMRRSMDLKSVINGDSKADLDLAQLKVSEEDVLNALARLRSEHPADSDGAK